MASGQQCQAQACAIQSCIQKSGYDESKCSAQIRALYTCCADMYERDPEARSTACPLISVVHRKLRQLEREAAAER